MKRTVIAYLAVVACVALAACSDTENEGEVSATDTTAAEGVDDAAVEIPDEFNLAGITDDEIHIAGVYSQALFEGLDVGARARLQRANDEGGVHGRQIVLDQMIDDGSDPNKNRDAVQRLVQQDKVFAIGPISTVFFNGADVAESGFTPYFGWAIGDNSQWCDREYAISYYGCPGGTFTTETILDYGHFVSQLLPEKSLEGTTIGIIGEDREIGNNVTAATYEAGGAEIVYNELSIPAPPAVVGDFSPFIQALMTSDDGAPPDVIELQLSAVPSIIQMSQGLRAAGYEGQIVNFLMYDPRVAPAADGVSTVIFFAPYEQEDTPAVDQMIEDIKAVNPDEMLTQAVAIGYWQMDLLVALLEETGPELTKSAFMETVNSGFEYEAPGALGPLDTVKARTEPVPCAAIVTGNGTGFDVTVPYQCTPNLPNPEAEGLEMPVTDAIVDGGPVRDVAEESQGLVLRDVVVAYGGIRALNGISLHLRPGRVYGIIGPNGAGKTTLFDVISGIQAPTSGSISLDGNDITRWSAVRRSRAGLRRTFQQLQVFGWLSVADNVISGLEWAGGGGGVLADALALPGRRRRHRERKAAAMTSLERCGIAHLAAASASSLAIGEARMVELARAIVGGPALLLLDEPASGLGEAETRCLSRCIEQLRSTDGGVLLVEHDVDFVMHHADEVIVMHLGKVIAQGAPEDVREDPAVRSAYLGEPVPAAPHAGEGR